jgi:hypothetical protein
MPEDRNTAAPTSSNPADYERAVQVQDDDVLLLEVQLAVKSSEYYRASAQAEVLRLEAEALRARMFYRLGVTYPEVEKSGSGGGTGIRRFEGALYYVGWDAR